MSKVQMPESVAEIMSGHTIHWAGNGAIAPLIERTGAKIGDRLITTTQAEAYAAAVRREALEEAAQLVDGRRSNGLSTDLRSIRNAIRALT
jgi:flagellar hook-associated protein FlgK